MMNINEDALLTGRVKHFFKDGNNVCGKKNAESNPDINIGGIGVTANHCQIAHVEEIGELTLTPHEDSDNSKTYLNGDLVTEPKELNHGDRVLFGNNQLYIIVKPPQEIDKSLLDYESIMKEML